MENARKRLEGNNLWPSLLAGFKLAYNSAVHSSTMTTPFQAAFARRPRLPFAPAGPLPDSKGQRLAERIREHATLLEEMNLANAEAIRRQKLQFDKRAKKRIFHIGDRVYVTRPHSGRQFQKFQPSWYGPFEVVFIGHNNNYGLMVNGRRQIFHANRFKMAPVPLQLYDKDMILPLLTQPGDGRKDMSDAAGDPYNGSDAAGTLTMAVTPHTLVTTMTIRPMLRHSPRRQ